MSSSKGATLMTMAAVTSEVVVTIWRAGVVKKAIPAQVAEWVRRYNMSRAALSMLSAMMKDLCHRNGLAG